MSVFVILDTEVYNKEKHKEYQKQVPAIIKKHLINLSDGLTDSYQLFFYS